VRGRQPAASIGGAEARNGHQIQRLPLWQTLDAACPLSAIGVRLSKKRRELCRLHGKTPCPCRKYRPRPALRYARTRLEGCLWDG
jgi:hypothetical protein